jgi:hypothetical protein
MSEQGFEVAAAYVTVSPDASNFADALDEQIGGLSIAVAVTPDASNFAAAFDEQVGGFSASVAVTPDTSDFASAVDEQTGGLTASVTLLVDPEGASDFGDAVSEQAGTVAIPVTAVPDVMDFGDMLGEETAGTIVPVSVVPDTADFADALGEQVGDLTVKVGVEPDAADFAEAALSTAGVGAVPVPVVPDPKSLANFGSAVEEGVSGEAAVTVVPDRKSLANFGTAVEQGLIGVAVTVEVTPGMGDFADAVQEQAYGLDVTVPVTADTSDAVESLQELQAAEDSAAASASQLSAIGDAAEADDSGIQTLYNGILSIGPAATQAEMEAVDALDGIRAAASSAVPADAITEPFAAVGPAAQSMASEVTSSLGEADSGIETFLSGIYSIGPAATEAGSAVQDAMGNARQAIADEASAFGSVDYTAATSGLEDVAGAAGDVAGAAPAAADASKGLSGILGELAGRMSYFAVDPFMWMYAAPVVIEGVAAAVKDLSDSTGSLVYELGVADQAGGFNVAGYQKLAGQLGQLSQAEEASTQSTGHIAAGLGRAGEAADAYAQVTADSLTQSQQQFTEVASNLSTHLGTLEQQYGITAQQAGQLVTAAGATSKELDGSGSAANDAMAKIEAYANANIGAQGPVNELANDVSTFGDDALTASTRVSALDDAYSMLVGRFATSQTDMLTTAQDFLTLEANATVAGASMSGVNSQSVALQQSFYATVQAVEQTANAMTQQGDSSAQVTAYIEEQTDKLSLLTGGNQQAQQAVQGLQQWEDSLRGSVDTTSQALLTSAGDLQNSFIKQLEDAGAKSATTKTDIDELTNSILATGTQSNATQADRAQLIKDLENAGLTAQKATQLVDGFIKSIQDIPSSKTVSIIETASGTITINETTGTATTQGAGGNASFHGAGGGPVYGGSGRPRADDIHAMLSHGEYVVQAPAVHKYGSDLLDSINHMHFAEGGPVGFADGGYSGDLSGLGAWAGMQYQSLQSGFTAQMEALLEAAVAAGKSGGASGRAPIIVNFNGTQMPTPEQTHALMTQLSAAVGVS